MGGIPLRLVRYPVRVGVILDPVPLKLVADGRGRRVYTIPGCEVVTLKGGPAGRGSILRVIMGVILRVKRGNSARS